MKKTVASGIILTAVLLIIGTYAVKSAGTSNSADNENMNAAFRDGIYLGNLASTRGESPHVSWGRWSEMSDRKSFAAGYEHAYGQQTANQSEKVRELSQVATRDATNAAFRDGVYVGKLDASEGRPVHISSGRWSRTEDRASFHKGYTQAYETITLARGRELNANGS